MSVFGDKMAPQKKNENGPVTAHFTSRVTTSVSVDNFRKRMERLSIMGEEELQNSSEIVSFQSKVIPLSLPEATNVGDVVYLVTVGIELQRQVSWNWCVGFINMYHNLRYIAYFF